MDIASAGTTDREITGTVITSIAGMVSCDPESVSPTTRLFEDLSFDSTMILELLMTLETELDTEFDPETLEPSDFDTVGALVGYLRGQLEG
jgi:acyl carrier protein